MQKITPFLWFDHQAEEAMHFYCSIFPNSKAEAVKSYGEGAPVAAGNITSVTFELEGQPFIAFNGGPHMTFSPAISFFVDCQTQQEVDELWEKLSAGGEQLQCGWLRDKFGVTWQIIPTALGEMLQNPDKQKSQKVLEAMLQMHKIDLEKLRQAFDG
ncbi:Glyoxalase superfamily enzyme [Abditibacterium utsteinense]|uniref:Glyoxalase superfamily enzyme n=1 Tax=Abditibacterium utsteinense TaxID=1960156 RepID=A0A2S8STK6_9BACT|nr:VOC family protein [Abditibacterium utsteinense]PQV64131.1 Glyoxalase superfamily enzyme [Abditibacterium utsteinense]